MYESHFGISGPPFQLSPDPNFYFDSKGHHEALAVLRRALVAESGFVIVSGEIGAGKTMLVRTLLEEVDATRVAIGQVLSTQLDDAELLRAILMAFGAPADGDGMEPLRASLKKFIDGLTREKRRAVLIVDEAQNLDRSAFEMLVEMEGRGDKRAPLKICLVGQPELRDIVQQPELRSLRDLIDVSCHLGPLDVMDTGSYIGHRLDKVGWKGSPGFDAAALDEIYRWTAGVPRRINRLCNRLMLTCFLAGKTRIDAALVETTARELMAEIGETGPVPPPVQRGAAAAATVPAAAPSPPAPVTQPAAKPAEAPAAAVTPAPAPAPAAPAVPTPTLPLEPVVTAKAAEPAIDLPIDLGVDVPLETPAAHAPVLTDVVGGRKSKRTPPAPPPPAPAAAPVPPQMPRQRPRGEPRPLLCVVGTQGDHVKAAALMHAFAKIPELPVTLLVRCYANNAFERNRDLFDGLDVDGRLVSLGIAGGTYAGRAAELMKRFEFVIDHCNPAAVIVFDGSDAALSCGLVASRKELPVLHVGAGMRAQDPPGAADITRKLADQLADVAYVADAPSRDRLVHDGVPVERIVMAGNLLVDALQMALRSALAETATPAKLGLQSDFLAGRNGYGVVVLDHPSNINDRQHFSEIVGLLRDISHDVPLVWPMHVRTREMLAKFRLDAFISGERIACLPALGYPAFVQLTANATCVMTDSWNVQEEATALSIPCMTVGVAPERSITSAIGSNTVVGKNRALATRAVWECMFNGGKRGRVPELWDGKAGQRIAQHVAAFLDVQQTAGVKARA